MSQPVPKTPGRSCNPAVTVKRRVLIVDDHPIVRQGLRRMIEPEADLTVCGEVQSDREARAAIRALTPDVVIVDISLGQGDGLELVRDVHAQRPELPMLVLSMHDETIYAERLLAAGASGYIMKQAASELLLIALRQVLAGGKYLSESLARSLGSDSVASPGPGADPIERLSNRELQVLSLIGRGLSSREAAEALGLSVKTIETHRQSLKRKLNLATNAQLLKYAINWYASRSNPPAAAVTGARGADGARVPEGLPADGVPAQALPAEGLPEEALADAEADLRSVD
jgi:DNA-binding NarL/FixJ family response regulator